MNLDEIPAGSFCALDTRVLIYAEQGYSMQCQRLLQRIETQEISGVLLQPVWQETLQCLMVMEAIMQGHVRGTHPSRQLASMPDIIQGLTLHRQKIKALAVIGLRFESCRQSDLIESSLLLQEQLGLMPRDALILAMSLRIGTDFLATTDSRYGETGRIPVASPTDVVLGSTS